MTDCAMNKLSAGWAVKGLTARFVEILSPPLPVAPLTLYGL